jgi:methanogenic corrinoid protein MtbC1
MQELEDYHPLAESSARAYEHVESRVVSARVVTPSFHQPAWRSALEKVIEAEIIPRLLMSYAPDAPSIASSASRKAPTTEDFTKLLLDQGPDEGLARMEALLADGQPMNTILLEHLAPAARRLGELWESDDCDFVEVTVGLRRLQFILQMLPPARPERGAESGRPRKILLLPAPGETHVFGLSILTRFFVADGWRVEQTTERSHAETLSNDWFDVVGFSLGGSVLANNLAVAIGEARAASRNPSISVLVGGAAFVARPELAQSVGADAVARDAPHAVALAQSLLNRQHAV